MSKRKLCLIVNPHGGQNLAKLPEILNVLRSGGYETNVHFKEVGGHTLELAEQAARDGCDLLVAYGGDGTLNQAVNGVLRVGGESVVGVLPGGTANLWANEIGVPTDNVLDAASILLDSEARRVDVGRVTVRDLFVPSAVLQVQGELLAEEQKKGKSKVKQAPRSHFLLMAGLGLDATVLQGVSKSLKYRLKRLAVGLSAAKELPAYRPFPLEVRADNGDLLWQGDALQVVVGNTRLYADVFHLTPNAYIDDGQLDICVLTAGNPLNTLQQVFSLLTRHQPDDLTSVSFRGARLVLRVPASIALQLDGSAVKLKKYLTHTQRQAIEVAANPEKVLVEYCFEAIPQALRVAIPRAYDNVLFAEGTSG